MDLPRAVDGDDRASGFAGRMQVLEGPTGRRRWPDEVKARIVQESFRSDALVSDVARRHGISPQQLTGWRRAAREGRLVLPWDDDGPGFVPVVVDDADRNACAGEASAEAAPGASMSGAIEIAGILSVTAVC